MNLTKIGWGLRAFLYKLKFRKIGMPSYVGKPIYISSGKNISCGKRVRIYPGLRAEVVNDYSSITIGNNVSIGQNFHVVSYNEDLRVGDNSVIAGNVFLTNCDHDYKGPNASVLENRLISKHTAIGNGCFIGNNAAILAGTVLGDRCVVGANSVVKGKFPERCVIAGVPAKIIKRF